MDRQKSKENIATSSKDAVSTIATSSSAIHSRQRIAQNFLLIWVDANIDESKKDCQNILAQFRSVVNDVNIFTQPDQCIKFLNDLNDEKAFLITPGYLGQYLVPKIHAMPLLEAIYILCGNAALHEQWTKEWVKIKGVCTEVKPICEALQLAAKQCNQDSIAMSFVTVDEGDSSQNQNKLEPSFMYTQIFKEILLKMKYDEKSIKGLAAYCLRKFYGQNVAELNIINEFAHHYQTKSPIWWYTRECFTYQMLNRALRTLEGDTIINMGFFIRDLHEQIEQLYREQIGTYQGRPFTVYRGQGLLKVDFEKLMKTKGALISFNNFLSTSTKRKMSLGFAMGALGKPDSVGILFKMTIDPSVSSTPFASIREVSYFQTEEEFLFSMHTVFRIGEITKINNNNSLYEVDLKLTADDDQELRTLTKRIREEVEGTTDWRRLGNLLLKLSQFDKAEELYTELLQQTSDESEKAVYYNNLGYIKADQGDYEKAIGYYEKALEINEKTLSPNHPELTTSYNNIAGVYDDMGEYSKALSFYEKAFEIKEKTLLPNHPDLATSYNNIGQVYGHMGEYSKALSFYEKALEIWQKTLPSNHPSLATSCNNIGGVYNSMGEYSKALSFYEKALEIKEKTLPQNHPDLASPYNNIGLVYDNMEEYSKALSFYEKALEIYQKTLPSNHPLLATSYNNIGEVYKNIKEYSKALSLHEKALEIRQKTLSPDHPDLATSYNNIGLVYKKMGEYSKALSFYEKDFEICQKTLSPNHPSLATPYNNIGLLYYSMGEYSKALSYLEHALDIKQRSLPPNHPSIQNVRESIEIVKEKLKTDV
jgi:tetratricopeptide (TPR) repeat protein